MAVQAQYPSHVLFLNRSEPPERKNTEYPVQAQPAGFLDQSTLLFPTQPSTGGSSNTNRKRGRESAAMPAGMAAMPHYAINLLSLQPQQQQQQPPATPVLNTNAPAAAAATTVIDLSLLQNHQPPPSTLVSTGLRLSFEDSHHHSLRPTQPQQQQQQQGQGSSFLSSLLTEEFAAQVKQQRDEINSYLQSQAEQLRHTLAESRRRHYRALLSLAEQSAARKMREKDAEMERATRRNAELEKRVAQLRAETVAWQAKARAEEAAAAALQAQLHQAAQERHGRGCAGDLGCSGGGGGADQAAAAEDAESAYVDPERPLPAAGGQASGAGAASAMACRACHGRVVSVLLLPCRHLCLCRECAAGAEACPVCLCPRTACLEVSFP